MKKKIVEWNDEDCERQRSKQGPRKQALGMSAAQTALLTDFIQAPATLYGKGLTFEYISLWAVTVGYITGSVRLVDIH